MPEPITAQAATVMEPSAAIELDGDDERTPNPRFMGAQMAEVSNGEHPPDRAPPREILREL